LYYKVLVVTVRLMPFQMSIQVRSESTNIISYGLKFSPPQHHNQHDNLVYGYNYCDLWAFVYNVVSYVETTESCPVLKTSTWILLDYCPEWNSLKYWSRLDSLLECAIRLFKCLRICAFRFVSNT